MEFIQRIGKSAFVLLTCSSAVAKKPRDVLCPSVVSFNSTVPRTQFFYLAIA